MKMILGAALVLSLGAASAARAAGGGEEKFEGPCKKIKEACEAAGYKKGEHKEKKGLILDCFRPILEKSATPPAGVTVAPADVDACIAKRQEKGNKK